MKLKNVWNEIIENNERNWTFAREGCHGVRNKVYLGAASEEFGSDWPIIIEILQKDSESALEILNLGRGFRKTLDWCVREKVIHTYYLHLPANQLIVEP